MDERQQEKPKKSTAGRIIKTIVLLMLIAGVALSIALMYGNINWTG